MLTFATCPCTIPAPSLDVYAATQTANGPGLLPPDFHIVDEDAAGVVEAKTLSLLSTKIKIDRHVVVGAGCDTDSWCSIPDAAGVVLYVQFGTGITWRQSNPEDEAHRIVDRGQV